MASITDFETRRTRTEQEQEQAIDYKQEIITMLDKCNDYILYKIWSFGKSWLDN